MNTNKLKAYAPKARLAFMDAVKKRAAVLGIYENKISEATTKGTDTLIEGRIFTRKQGQQRQQLVNRIETLGGGKDGYNQFINEMAFTWFNRFTAIRFMEVNGYLDHGFRMLSKEVDAEFGQGFEILAHAADVAEDLGLNKSDIVEMLLAGDKEEELYRELLLAQCHQLSKIMPFMFEKLDDATELLLPDNLTKTDSILKELVNDVPEDNWREIEVIGWLYQFYISEHKDAVIGKVVKKEDIPAATQLFTPNWIVKYLVQNSLGRQWLATYPDSELKDKMEYFITPAEQSDEVIEQLKAITPTSIDPEQIKVLDPACGSGHILVEVYEVLREIYLERGYRLREIPELILTKNIYGLDIDDRATQMAAFAVLMKAREDDRRIFSRVEDNHIKLNIHAIQSTEHLNINQLWHDLDLDGNKQTGSMEDLFAEQSNFIETSAENQQYLDLLRYLKALFIDGKNLGSLIKVDSAYSNTLKSFKAVLQQIELTSNPNRRDACQILCPIITQAFILSQKFDVVVANPPYVGFRYLNPTLKAYLQKEYAAYSKDLYAAFVVANLNLTKDNGHSGYMTPMVWMFIDSFEELRNYLTTQNFLTSLVQLEYNASGSVRVPLCTYVVQKTKEVLDRSGSYIRLTSFSGDHIQGAKTLEAIRNHECGWFYNTKPTLFSALPGTPIAYWLSTKELQALKNKRNMSSVCEAKQGLSTGDTNRFLRYWFEIPYDQISFECESEEEFAGTNKRWAPYNKGGSFRKWYGNQSYVVDWGNKGQEIDTFRPKSVIRNRQFYFKECISWSDVTSAINSFRYYPKGFIFDTVGHSAFFETKELMLQSLGNLNSDYIQKLIPAINPTMHFSGGYFLKLPFIESNAEDKKIAIDNVRKLIKLAKDDWNGNELSFNFDKLSVVRHGQGNLKQLYLDELRASAQAIQEYQDAEKNLQVVISKSLALDCDEIPVEQVTLFKNDSFIFPKTYDAQQKLNARCSLTSYEIISYAIGCAMGRYSLDREGLVYAHSENEGFKELVTDGAYKTFPADDDGIVPLAAEDWLFDDDATSRFRDFVKTVWGEEHLQENLDFVAESLCLDAIKPKKNESAMETIRRYFSTQFYKDHLKTYKKRPIYWLFSSGKEKAFECLVYLHRYNESTLARMRTEYVTPLMGKLETQHSVLTESRTNASSTEQRRIDKELKSIEKKQSELRAFDEELKHLAEMKISIDLDDGVKVNYGKFGNLLADVKAIHGKNPEEIK